MSFLEKVEEVVLIELCAIIVLLVLIVLAVVTDTNAVASSVETEMEYLDNITSKLENATEEEEQIEEEEIVEESTEADTLPWRDIGLEGGFLIDPEFETEAEIIEGPFAEMPDGTVDGTLIESKVEEQLGSEKVTEVFQIEFKSIELEGDALEEWIANYPYEEDKALALAQLMWEESRGCSKREQSMVAWTVLNRVDIDFDGQVGFWAVLTAPAQFAYPGSGRYEEYELEMAREILQHWAAEKDGFENTIRTLPHGYVYYHSNSDHTHNLFGATEGQCGELWFGLGDPYEG